MVIFGLFGPPNVDKLKLDGNVKGLYTILKSEKDNNLRLSAIAALGSFGNQKSIEILIEIFKGSNPNERNSAVKALVNIGAPAVESLIACLRDSNHNVIYCASNALEGIGAPAVEPLITSLKDSPSDARFFAAAILNNIGAPAVEPLIASLRDQNSDLRIFSAMILGEIGDKRAIEPLKSCLQDSNPAVCMSVAKALNRID